MQAQYSRQYLQERSIRGGRLGAPGPFTPRLRGAKMEKTMLLAVGGYLKGAFRYSSPGHLRFLLRHWILVNNFVHEQLIYAYLLVCAIKLSGAYIFLTQ